MGKKRFDLRELIELINNQVIAEYWETNLNLKNTFPDPFPGL